MLIHFSKTNLVSVFDALFALIFVGPLVVTFWSTSWKLHDLFIYRSDPLISGGISWLFGFGGQMVLMFYQESIKKLLHFEQWDFVNMLILKVYALFLGHTFVSFWRGVWSVVDATSSRDIGAITFHIVQNVVTLMIVRAFRNTLVPPFFILTDRQEQYNMRTLLEKYKANGSFTYLLDCLSTMFVEMLIAFIWHDVWLILDSNIYPDDVFYSALTSLVIGYSLALLCFIAQNFVGIMCEKYDEHRVFIYDIFTIVALLSAINVWRGVWTFIAYFAGNNKKWNLILNTLAWFSLMVANCTFSLSAKDVLKDAEKSGRSCTKLQTRYFSDMLDKEAEKKVNEVLTI